VAGSDGHDASARAVPYTWAILALKMTQTHSVRFSMMVVAAAITACTITPLAHADSAPCDEGETVASAQEGKSGLVELDVVATRATFDVPLADNRSGEDDIRFPTKAGRRLAPGVNTVSAQLPQRPRNSSGALGGTYLVAARPDEAGKGVIVDVCVRDTEMFRAGQFSGTIDVFGPKIADFSYAIVITKKWPWWTAATVLGLAILAFVGGAALTGSLTFNISGSKGRKRAATGAGVVVGAALAALVYWGTYWKNPTWGSDPQAEITALFVAGFTAATGGLALVQRLIR
jgi:hypothetical protein